MSALMYWLTASAYFVAVLGMLAGLAFAMSLEMGRWWRREDPSRQTYGIGSNQRKLKP